MRQGQYRDYPTPTQDLLATQGLKMCGKCKTPKAAAGFSKRKTTTCGLSSWCVLCNRQYDRDNRERFKRQRMNRWYIRTYHITLREFEAMIAAQDGLCKICIMPMKEPHLDHDHETGELRGVLCHKCNVGLGHFNDSIKLLRRALEYLGGIEWNQRRQTIEPMLFELAKSSPIQMPSV